METLESRHLLAATPLDLNPNGEHVGDITAVGDALYVTTTLRGDANQLVRIEGTTTQVLERPGLVPLGESDPGQLFQFKDDLWFLADVFDDAGNWNGRHFHRTDGTVAGTQLAVDLRGIAVGLRAPIAATDQFFFIGRESRSDDLWVSDGTKAGSRRVTELPFNSSFSPLTTVGSSLFFSYKDEVVGRELWASDGTASGTRLVADLNPNGDSKPNRLIEFQDHIYFRASDGIDTALWRMKSDGTSPERFFDTNPNGVDSTIPMTASNGFLFFESRDADGVERIWKTDGTAEGTAVVSSEVRAHDAVHSYFAAVDGTIFFPGSDRQSGRELWKTDGTAEGTQIVADIFTVFGAGSGPSRLTNVGTTIFFFARDDEDVANGIESLWQSDGTEAGTKKVDIGPIVPVVRDMTAAGDSLYFLADDAQGNRQLWTTSSETTGNGGTNDELDLSPLHLEGEFSLDEQDGIWRSSGMVQVGFKPAEGEAFQPLVAVDGDVSYTNARDGVITANGSVSSSVVDLGVPLFEGEWTIPIGETLTSTLTDLNQFQGGEFELGGATLQFDGLRFVNQPKDDNDKIAVPRVELRGTAKLPDVLDGIEASITADDFIALTVLGPTFTGVDFTPLSEDTQKLNLAGFELEAMDIKLRFDNQKKALLLGGVYKLPQFNTVVDLNPGPRAGGGSAEARAFIINSPAVDVPAVDFVGQIRVEIEGDDQNKIELFEDWFLSNLIIDINTSVDAFNVTGTATILAPDDGVQDASFPTTLSITPEEGIKLTATSAPGTDFRAFGVNVDVALIEYISDRKPGDGPNYDPELRLAGKLSLPTALIGPEGKIDGAGDLEFVVTKARPLRVSSDGFEMSQGRLALRGFWKVKLFDIAEVRIDNPAITFDTKEKSVKFEAKVTLPSLNNATFDFVGDRYVKLQSGKLPQLVGEITIPEPINITEDGKWQVKDIRFTLDTVNTQYTGTAKIKADTRELSVGADLNVNGFTVMVASDPPQKFDLLGMEVTVASFTFISDRFPGPFNPPDWDPQVKVQGALKLPKRFANLTVEIKDDNELVIDSDGVNFSGAKLILPGEQTFVAAELFEIQTVDATLDLNLDTSTAKLEGKFLVPTLNNFELDLLQDRHLTLRENGGNFEVAMNAILDVDSIPIFDDYSLQDVHVEVAKDFTQTVGTVSGSTTLALPNGKFALGLEFLNGRLTSASVGTDEGKDFTILKTDVDIRNLTFKPDRNLTNADFWEPQFEFQGSLKFPPALDNAELAFNDPNRLVVNESGFEVTGGKIPFPNVDFQVGGVFDVHAEKLALDYNGETQTFRLQGLVTLPSLFNATADFADPNFIEIGPERVNVVGTLSVDDIQIVPGVWEVPHAELSINTLTSSVTGQAQVRIPAGVTLDAGVGFVGSELNFLSLGIEDGLNQPIGTTGAFLQGIKGKVDHIAKADPAPVEFGGGVKVTGGPRVNVRLPEFAGGGFSGALVELDVDGSINDDRLEAIGRIEIVGGLVSGTGSAELNWDRGFLAAQAEFNALGGLITTDTRFRADSSYNITMTGSANVIVPKEIPVIGESPVGSANMLFHYRNDATPENDFVAGWGTVSLVVFEKTLGFKVGLDGSFGLVGAEVLQEATPAANAAALSSPAYAVAEGREFVLLSANWTNAQEAVAVEVIAPDGSVLSESDIDARPDMAVVGALSGPNDRVVVVQTPSPGNWRLRLPETDGLGQIQFDALASSPAPEIEIIGVTSDADNQLATIEYSAFDPDSDARISLFYDSDQADFDGIPIADSIVEMDGSGTHQWNTTNAPAGEYYVYAMIMDDSNAPVFSNYADAQILIVAPPQTLLQGDINLDGKVAFNDFLILADNFGKEDNATPAEGDLDDDGRVGFSDFLILAENFGRTAASSALQVDA